MLHERFISVAPSKCEGRFHERKSKICAAIRQTVYAANGGWNTVAIKMQARRTFGFPSIYRKRLDLNVVGNTDELPSYIIRD
jgi:hypothetical protein